MATIRIVFPLGTDISSIPEVVKMNGTRDNPIHTLYIGRSMNMGGWRLAKSKWANPYKGEDAVDKYYNYVLTKPELMDALHELGGQKLGCWCVPKPCHGNALQYLYSIVVLHGSVQGSV